VTEGPYLYDEGPESLYKGAGRSRRGLLVAILLGTVLVAVALVVTLPLVKGTPGEQAGEAARVFVAALQKGDDETAYGLLCADERARLQPEQMADEYLRAGTPRIGGATEGTGGPPAERVEVRWTDGGAVTSTFLRVVNEGGAHVCGTTSGG
jgi:hypothetical protein